MCKARHYCAQKIRSQKTPTEKSAIISEHLTLPSTKNLNFEKNDKPIDEAILLGFFKTNSFSVSQHWSDLAMAHAYLNMELQRASKKIKYERFLFVLLSAFAK